MREITQTKKFRKDYKKIATSGRYCLDDILLVVDLLANDKNLPLKYRDHCLSNNWQDHRDCHIKPDLILIYRKPDHGILELVRLGSHSQLGL
jgi:mRNA interferase YafQ